jgi:hypothetical protein
MGFDMLLHNRGIGSSRPISFPKEHILRQTLEIYRMVGDEMNAAVLGD